ncbi:hypothetical protein CU097_015383 [Rhizopus azygosporus]|uniref:Uncharacterized protein n=1 Tax=Rhizopus azygosporus TaxID=86630 RepID=A0A367KHI6_RHIAZ|nr:hypothetical protein CU097_015383 [Rhizopus azygosporus]
MVQFIAENRYPSLIKFSNQQPETSNIQPENATTEEAMSEEDLNEENSTSIMTQQVEPDDYILENGFNISARFRLFNLESNKRSKEPGFYIKYCKLNYFHNNTKIYF